MAAGEKFIDVRKVLKDKNPGLYKIMPEFAVRYLQNLVHENEFNHILETYDHVKGVDFCEGAIEYFNIDLSFEGLENVPETGGCILASNHPLGGMDAMALVTILKEKRKDIRFIVNDILLNLKNLKGLFVGVNKHGANVKESLRKVDELFASDMCVCIFPAGLVSRKTGGVVRDLEWQKTFVSRAKKYKKPVVPVHIDGRLTNWFYNLANLRGKLGIKANIEMLYLADEMIQQKNKSMNVIFGKPIDPVIFDRSKTDKQWAATVRDIVYELPTK